MTAVRPLTPGGTSCPKASYWCELDADDVHAPLRELGARASSGVIEMSDVIQLDPPPAITLYELTD